MLSSWKEASAQIRAEWRAHVSDADVSGHHAQIIARMMDDCCDAIDEGGFGGLGEYLDRTINELRNARMSDDRGTRIASYPYWKIVACAAVVGVSVIWVIAAIVGKWPWWAWFMIALVGCILMTLAVMGCPS